MQEENALVTEYEKLLASAKIDWEGEILNLSLLTPYLKSKDPEVRRKAAEKQNAFFDSIADQLDELYDKLVKNRTEQAKKLGFETYTPCLLYTSKNRRTVVLKNREREFPLHLRKRGMKRIR